MAETENAMVAVVGEPHVRVDCDCLPSNSRCPMCADWGWRYARVFPGDRIQSPRGILTALGISRNGKALRVKDADGKCHRVPLTERTDHPRAQFFCKVVDFEKWRVW